jgi:hypothetical protein
VTRNLIDFPAVLIDRGKNGGPTLGRRRRLEVIDKNTYLEMWHIEATNVRLRLIGLWLVNAPSCLFLEGLLFAKGIVFASIIF